jgi:hypothetical protein
LHKNEAVKTMTIKKFKSKEEAVKAIKEAATRKRIWTEQVQSGRSVSELKDKDFKLVKFC